MTQKERLLKYLFEHKSIDPLTGWSELGIYRLGARIFDLRKDGYIIENRKKVVLNKWGEKCAVANYCLWLP